VSLDALVTHHFPLDQVGQAMETAHSRTGGAIKVVVHPTTG
jgi:threonine dehydrogenase-like Zn-dependent dehydrogenase